MPTDKQFLTLDDRLDSIRDRRDPRGRTGEWDHVRTRVKT